MFRHDVIESVRLVVIEVRERSGFTSSGQKRPPRVPVINSILLVAKEVLVHVLVDHVHLSSRCEDISIGI